ncbi:hypothetical protein FB45DRAFT_895738 [Roridomyces roridus]|uniref:Uncharacterized protein n=1 Tax=Roridomyces roridus TaxID=1738132 RepID=A0AAD7CA81_9AGAR|nr:hypothetical protein FB45DRAFT_895738 [Roridomyces roridus]
MTTVSIGTSPIAHAHPYVACHDQSSNVLSLWTFGEEPLLHATIEDQVSRNIRPHAVSADRLLTQSIDDDGKSTILVHSLSDGRILSSYPLGSGAVYISREGFIAGCDERAKLHVYELAADGQLAERELRGQAASNSSDIPQAVHLTADVLIHSQVRHPDPTVHLTRLSPDAPPSQASFPLTRTPPDDIPGVVMNSMLVNSLAIPSSSTFITAHVEQVLDFTEDCPKTALRCIDAETLALGWCTLIDQHTEWLRYSTVGRGVVLAFGLLGTEEGAGLIALDATTGTILRTERIGLPPNKCGSLPNAVGGVHCDLTPSGDRVVVLFGDGQISSVSVETFLASGFVRDGESGLLMTSPCPEIPLSTPTNAKERRGKTNGAWTWINRAFVTEGGVVVVPNKGTDFVVLKW